MDNDRAQTDTLVVLRMYDNPTQAEIAKSVLDSAGVFCVLHGEIMSSIYPIGSFPTRLMVKPSDLELAESLLCIEH